MQELRLVAVSEDGSYLVLATAGRGTRFTLPVDDRLRAAVRGHFSRLGQFEIEVESPLRPKEIQARIRAGETAEEIAETAGIPVERVRWFEGPVLQEREYMAQQAQRVVLRRPGESTPGPLLGEIVENRLGRRGVDLEEVEWDSWKCEDSTWRVRLSFFLDGRPYAAEWVFDPRRRHVSALDEEAARLSSLELDSSVTDTVTPLAPRRMKIVSDGRDDTSRVPRPPVPPAPHAPEPTTPAADPAVAETSGPAASSGAEPAGGDIEEILAATQESRPSAPARETAAVRPEPQEEAPAAESTAPDSGREAAAAAARPERTERGQKQRSRQRAKQRPEPAARPDRSEPAARRDEEIAAQPPEPETEPETAAAPAKEVAEHVAAAANGGTVAPGAKTPPAQPNRSRRKGSARGKRASVPSWDEIMFGARRPE
ncbi:MAG TPA: septation protein SepH [Streptosporangiaceae bacterium]|jgi:hypothetical protein